MFDVNNITYNNVFNKSYWYNFYRNLKENNDCSDFCIFAMNYIRNNKNINSILDAGCGNGRDSYCLAKKYTVVGMDNSGFIPDKEENVEFVCDDFVRADKSNYQLIYSRFTFHSITNEDHDIFLESIRPNTYLAMEARSIKDISNDAYHGKNHYRNYIDIEYLKNILTKYNFEILYIYEGKDVAIYRNENPICIRVICIKL